MHCTGCGSRFFSAAAEQMLDAGATCDCGVTLTAAPLAEPQAEAVRPEGRAADEDQRG